jgi:hypothetical protein
MASCWFANPLQTAKRSARGAACVRSNGSAAAPPESGAPSAAVAAAAPPPLPPKKPLPPLPPGACGDLLGLAEVPAPRGHAPPAADEWGAFAAAPPPPPPQLPVAAAAPAPAFGDEDFGDFLAAAPPAQQRAADPFPAVGFELAAQPPPRPAGAAATSPALDLDALYTALPAGSRAAAPAGLGGLHSGVQVPVQSHPMSGHPAPPYGVAMPMQPHGLMGALGPQHHGGEPYAHAPPHGPAAAGAHPAAGRSGPHILPAAFAGPLPPPPFL